MSLKSEFNDLTEQMNKTMMEVFYERNFTRKMCIRFFPDTLNPEICHGCRYKEEDHYVYDDMKTWSKSAHNWRPELHLEPIVSKEIRKINFINQTDNYEKMADFCILSNDTHPNTVLNVLLREWQIEKPNLVISVTGSSRYLPFKPAHFEKLKAGFMRIVHPTKCWIITGGTALGVDNLISEVMKESQYLEWMGTDAPSFYMIGLSNWNCIDQNSEINQTTLHSNKPYAYQVQPTNKFIKFSKELITPLNPLYSHFVFIEGGVRGKWGQEIKVRSAVEQYIVQPRDAGGEGIPLVLIVIGGEFDTFERASNALDHSIPIVVCKGCGGAGDILARALRFPLTNTGNISDENINELKQLLDEMNANPKLQGCLFPDEAFEASKHIHFLLNCLKYRAMINVFDLDESDIVTLDSVLIESLLNSSAAKHKDPVNLSMAWNRCDPVICKILNQDIEKVSNDINNLANIERYMTKAILENKLDFVKLFIELGYDMDRFLSKKKLSELYNYTINHYPPFRVVISKHTWKSKMKTFFLKDVYKICYNLTGCQLNTDIYVDNFTNSSPFRELAIWAVLSNRWELSFYFWTNSNEPIILALLLSQLWTAVASALSADEMDEEEVIIGHSKEMLDLAVNILKVCWDTNKELSEEMVKFKYKDFGYRNQIRVAGLIEAKNFIAEDCFQVTIDNLWKGGLRNRLLQTYLCLFIPIMVRYLKLNQSLLDDFDEDWIYTYPIKYGSNEIKLKRKSTMRKPNIVETSQPSPKFSFSSKLFYFYNAPLTKFCAHLCSYIAFLLIFSIFYMFHFTEGTYSIWEFLVFIFMLCYAFEEIRQILLEDASFSMKIRLWAQNEWNIVDFFYITMFFIAFMLSSFSENEKIPFTDFAIPGYEIANVLYGCVCMLLWVRLLRFYQCTPQLGQIWIMIRRMLVETLLFMTILCIVVISAGFTMRILINYYIPAAKRTFSDVGFQWIFLRSFYTFNGELFLDRAQDIDNPAAIPIYYTLTLLFLLIGNALLLNLLIALYGSIFSEVSQRAEIEWKSEMLSLMREYEDKTFLPPPFNILETFYLLFSYFINCRGIVRIDNVEKREKIQIFETYCLNIVMSEKRSEISVKESIENSLIKTQISKKQLSASKHRIKNFSKILQSQRKKFESVLR